MVQGKCKTCGETIRSRRSHTHSAQANFLTAVRKHYKKKHPNTLSRRISSGIKASQNNPSIQDMVTALQEGVRSALVIYGKWTETQYQAFKKVIDALEPFLPPEIVISWRAIEAIHDAGERT